MCQTICAASHWHIYVCSKRGIDPNRTLVDVCCDADFCTDLHANHLSSHSLLPCIPPPPWIPLSFELSKETMKLLTIAVVAVALLCGSLPMAAASCKSQKHQQPTMVITLSAANVILAPSPPTAAEADQPLPWVTPTGGLVWVWVFGIIFTLLGYAVV